MIAYQKEKIENSICFFASEHIKQTKQPLHQTFLYKYLAFLDFKILKETGRPCLGLSYKAMEHGPVPMEIYGKLHEFKSPCFTYTDGQENKITIQPKGKPNLDYFSQKEIKQMQRLIEIFAQKYVKAGLISDASHQDIIAWKKTWNKCRNGMIDYSAEFDDNLFKKKEEELSYPEESFLIYRALGT
ncbi:MAG: DUF4065 domain-containing protein [Deltaproteobacteria bacterium]|nr:DUF4065 domain-containing protein [Deltaproteobacteria bacterium]